MSAVFSHGRLRLYLLKLLAEGPKHGYELIRLLENRFHGLYAPSAGTIYPRLARLQSDGLVAFTAAGGRKIYEITPAGRTELAQRSSELADLETEVQASVADLAALAESVEEGVRGSLRDLKRELRAARHEAREQPRTQWRHWREAIWSSGGPPRPPEPDQAEDPSDPSARLSRAAGELADEVRRLVRQGRASVDELRVAETVLASVREQLRRILHG